MTCIDLSEHCPCDWILPERHKGGSERQKCFDQDIFRVAQNLKSTPVTTITVFKAQNEPSDVLGKFCYTILKSAKKKFLQVQYEEDNLNFSEVGTLSVNAVFLNLSKVFFK